MFMAYDNRRAARAHSVSSTRIHNMFVSTTNLDFYRICAYVRQIWRVELLLDFKKFCMRLFIGETLYQIDSLFDTLSLYLIHSLFCKRLLPWRIYSINSWVDRLVIGYTLCCIKSWLDRLVIRYTLSCINSWLDRLFIGEHLFVIRLFVPYTFSSEHDLLPKLSTAQTLYRIDFVCDRLFIW